MNSTHSGDQARRGRRQVMVVATALLGLIAIIVAIWLVGRASDTSGAGSSQPPIAASADGPTDTAGPTPATPSPASPTPASPASTSSSPLPSRSGRPTTATVAPDANATLAPGVRVKLTRVESIQGEADLPGDIAGPALRVSVEVTNDSGAVVPLSGSVVNAYYGSASTPAIQLSRSGTVPFPASLPRNRSVTARFVYKIPTQERDDVTIEVDLSALGRPVIFKGSFG